MFVRPGEVLGVRRDVSPPACDLPRPVLRVGLVPIGEISADENQRVGMPGADLWHAVAIEMQDSERAPGDRVELIVRSEIGVWIMDARVHVGCTETLKVAKTFRVCASSLVRGKC